MESSDSALSPETEEKKVSKALSSEDDGFPTALFAEGMKKCLSEAEKATERIYLEVARNAPEAAQFAQRIKKGSRLVVDVSQKMLDDIDKGKIKLSTDKSGKMFAQMMDGSHYAKKLPIKKESLARAIDPVQMANAMQLQALQLQLESITHQLSLIDQSVHQVVEGLQNDRIGLYYSGAALYVEARNTADGELQKALLTQALRALTEATFQLSLTMRADIRYLAEKGYENAKGKRAELIRERIDSINQSFLYVHQASLLRAAIYCNQSELSAMAIVLDEYSHFIEETVAKNALLLAQCDSTDNGTEEGIWRARANLRLDVSAITGRLRAPEKTLYLGITEDEA